jgi:hypothetical protein
VAALALPLPSAQRRFDKTLAARVRFGYPNSTEEDRLVSRLLARIPRGTPCVVALPPGVKLGPTIRLALRLRDPGLAPDEVVAGDDPAEKLLREVAPGARFVRLYRFTR